METNKNDFFVGYGDGVPKSFKKGIRNFVFLAILVLIIASVFFSISQRPFADSTFELTSETTLSGIYSEMPYPMLLTTDSLGNNKTIMLLGFGKKGANSYVDHLNEELGTLVGSNIEITGNLIYYHNKTLLQITSQEKVKPIDQKNLPSFSPEKSLGKHKLQGEIVDPKCYFGVMKPGFGKIHRSCAIRCISGGIPPVFASKDRSGATTYYIITDPEGNPIHEELANYIGKPTQVSGELLIKEDWNYLQLDISQIEFLERSSSLYK